MQLVKPTDLILRKVCRADFTVSLTTIQQMFDLLRQVRGLGLAAPQVGIDARLFITEWGEVFINPRIVRINGAIHVTDSCLSLPGFIAGVDRWNHIRLADGRVYNSTRALIVQHEIDHLDGILITDLPQRRHSIMKSHR